MNSPPVSAPNVLTSHAFVYFNTNDGDNDIHGDDDEGGDDDCDKFENALVTMIDLMMKRHREDKYDNDGFADRQDNDGDDYAAHDNDDHDDEVEDDK